VIRKFNYTGRKTIKRSNIRIDLLRDEQAKRFFNISLHLEELNLPTNAHVYVEAYHRTGYQRFDFGTVDERTVPFDLRLSQFSDSTIPLFRVKVVDKTDTHGRILAAVDKIRPESVDALPAGGQSLLFVEYDDMGDIIWQLDMDGDWPVLKLNRRIEEISLVASSDNRFLPLVYPEVFRQILHRILVVDQHTDPDCDDDWPSLWLKLACSLPGMSIPPQRGRANQQAWIERAVGAFGYSNKMLQMFNQAMRDSK
jgi:hypothetical protein